LIIREGGMPIRAAQWGPISQSSARLINRIILGFGAKGAEGAERAETSYPLVRTKYIFNSKFLTSLKPYPLC
jgi:hypothetical protein